MKSIKSVSFNVRVVNGIINQLTIPDECPVEKPAYLKMFGSIPDRDYTVTYILNSRGKYKVNPPGNSRSWPFLSVVGGRKPRLGDYDCVYVCKIPVSWYNLRVSRKVETKKVRG